MAELETVDIPGIEILASGGPVRAIGSPPEGDFYTREELVGIVDAHRELGSEIRAPIKLGHSDVQQLAANSGLTAGEMPALGWLDNSSFRVEDDEETGVAKLVADAKAVPKKVADLMRVGAYRTRSSEIRHYSSQATQKTYDWVVEGLALMGEKIPAIQTLDDVYRLYERAGIDKPDADTFVIRKHAAAAAPIWDVEDGLEDLRGDLNDALNPAGYDLPGVPSLWVRDVARSSTVALVSQGWDNNDDAWVVPFTINDDGTVTVAPRAEWKAAEQTWVASSSDLARKNGRPAESRPAMPEITFTDEQATAVRERLGLDAETEITADSFADAVAKYSEARANEKKELENKLAELETRKNEASQLETTVRKLESDLKVEQTKRFEMERDADLDAALADGRIVPADLEAWKADYTENQDFTRRALSRLRPDENLARVFGRDNEESDETLEDEAYNREFEARHGMKAQV